MLNAADVAMQPLDTNKIGSHMGTRELFEEFYSEGSEKAQAQKLLERDASGEYKYMATYLAWKYWAAGASAERVACAEEFNKLIIGDEPGQADNKS